MAAGSAVGQAPPAPTTSALHAGDEALTVVWTAPEGVTGVTAYDLRWILTSADETVDSNWTVEEDVWTEGELLYVLFGLINGSGYDVQVRAVTDADGAWSTTVGATPAEPINVFVAAVALPLGLPVGAVLTSPDDYDLFRFTLTEETGVILFARGPVDTVGVLYDEDAVSLDDNDDSGLGGEPWNFAIGTSLDAGTYYVQVSGAPSSGTGTYTVHAGTIRDTTGRGTAQEVALGSTEVGLFESKGDRDYFRFTLEESANVSVRSGGPFTDAGRGHDYRGAGLLGALSSHGTSTAGIVAARDNDLGGRGVAPRATVYGYNFLRTGAGTLNRRGDAQHGYDRRVEQQLGIQPQSRPQCGCPGLGARREERSHHRIWRQGRLLCMVGRQRPSRGRPHEPRRSHELLRRDHGVRGERPGATVGILRAGRQSVAVRSFT